jgi:hypothetical protein
VWSKSLTEIPKKLPEHGRGDMALELIYTRSLIGPFPRLHTMQTNEYGLSERHESYSVLWAQVVDTIRVLDVPLAHNCHMVMCRRRYIILGSCRFLAKVRPRHEHGDEG